MCYFNHEVGKRREKTEFGLPSSKQAQHNSCGRSLQLNVMIDSLSITHHFTHDPTISGSLLKMEDRMIIVLKCTTYREHRRLLKSLHAPHFNSIATDFLENDKALTSCPCCAALYLLLCQSWSDVFTTSVSMWDYMLFIVLFVKLAARSPFLVIDL